MRKFHLISTSNLDGQSSNNIIRQPNHQFSSKFEFDTIGLYIERHKLSDVHLNSLKKIFKVEKVNEFTFKGRYKGFHLSYNDFHLKLFGSFSNYKIGILDTLPYKNFYSSVESLSKEINISLHEFKLSRIDINWNYITRNCVDAYSKNLFLKLSRFKRLERENGVLFRTKEKEIEFYNRTDKIKTDPQNWLRLEFRIMKSINKHLGVIYLKDLYEIAVYRKILQLVKKIYFKIEKEMTIIDNYKNIISPKLLENYLMMLGINKVGLSNLYKHIDQIDKLGEFDNSNQKYRLRKKVCKLSENEGVVTKHPLIQELDEMFMLDYTNEIGGLEQ